VDGAGGLLSTLIDLLDEYPFMFPVVEP